MNAVATPELDLDFDPASETALRMAFDHLDYARYGITFEQACENKSLRICMRVNAEIIHRKRNEARLPKTRTPRRRRGC